MNSSTKRRINHRPRSSSVDLDKDYVQLAMQKVDPKQLYTKYESVIDLKTERRLLLEMTTRYEPAFSTPFQPLQTTGRSPLARTSILSPSKKKEPIDTRDNNDLYKDPLFKMTHRQGQIQQSLNTQINDSLNTNGYNPEPRKKSFLGQLPRIRRLKKLESEGKMKTNMNNTLPTLGSYADQKQVARKQTQKTTMQFNAVVNQALATFDIVDNIGNIDFEKAKQDVSYIWNEFNGHIQNVLGNRDTLTPSKISTPKAKRIRIVPKKRKIEYEKILGTPNSFINSFRKLGKLSPR